MKKNNKGFSLVELIIVIAIMAILAGALAPALIKYINKSRRSTDISNAQTIATAVTSALANEDAYDACGASATTYDVAALQQSSTNAFTSETANTLGTAAYKCKYGPYKGGTFTVQIDKANNLVEVYAGSAVSADAQLYPEQGADYQ